jgi:type I restriction enzyme M protein
MAKYITKPFEYLENVVGVEINFNEVFYQPEKLRSVEEILGEIAALDEELRNLEAQNAC